VAAKQAHSFTHHGITVTDDYAWLRDADYPDVKDEAILAHLNAENAWFESRMAGQKDRIDALFTEMRARIKEADKSVPQRMAITSIGSNMRKAPNTRNGGASPLRAAKMNDARRVALAQGKNISASARFRSRRTANCWRGVSMTMVRSVSPPASAVIETGEVLPDVIEGLCPRWSGSRGTRGWSIRWPMRTGARTMPACTGWAAGVRGCRAVSRG
jgi:oligopeptidase B